MSKRPGYCLSCERYIGPSDFCPYCDTPSNRLLPIRVLRFLALGSVVLGLVLLAVFRSRLVPPSVPLSDLQPAMHGALIVTGGQLTSTPRQGRTRTGQSWFSLTLEENGRTLRVVARGEAADSLRSSPPLSSSAVSAHRIQVVGRLQWNAGDEPVLFLQKESDLSFLTPP